MRLHTNVMTRAWPLVASLWQTTHLCTPPWKTVFLGDSLTHGVMVTKGHKTASPLCGVSVSRHLNHISFSILLKWPHGWFSASSLPPATPIFSSEVGTGCLRIFSWHRSLWSCNSSGHLVWSCVVASSGNSSPVVQVTHPKSLEHWCLDVTSPHRGAPNAQNDSRNGVCSVETQPSPEEREQLLELLRRLP